MLADSERGCLGGFSIVDNGLKGLEVLAAISSSLFSPAGFCMSWLEVAAKGLALKDSTSRDILSSGESALFACRQNDLAALKTVRGALYLETSTSVA